jgi:CBS domain-containing protein
MTSITELMTRDVRTLSPRNTVAEAAQDMAELNVGVIPVCEGDKLIGVVTDRDIVVRSVARGLDGRTTTLADVMSTQVRTALASDDVYQVLTEMSASQIRRLPVVDEAQRLIGIISIGDIAATGRDEEDVGQSLGDISETLASSPSAA